MKAFTTILYFFCLAVLGLGCQPTPNKVVRTENRQFIDANLDTLNLGLPYPKVMGLSPALTEILYSVLPDSQIVGVTHVCNYPAQVKEKKRIVSYPLDVEGIIALKPDVVFYEEGFIAAESINKLKEFGINTFAFQYQKIADIFQSMKTVAAIGGNASKGDKVADSLKAGLEKLDSHLTPTKTALAVISVNPMYVFGRGTIISEAMHYAGISNVVDTSFGKFPELQREALLKMDPDIILGASYGQLDTFLFKPFPEMRQLKVYTNKQCYPLADDLASRPSPRILALVKEIKGKMGK
jgi:iron complex transport system substrate-binding protein